ncbi:MAG TPA: sugar phosphate isomerase/epimerase family protein [Bacteroidales bacterium]|nr:sugar phosphate isomerase/epimerase [Bacteroidales bacterium]HOU95702.1 sugar phosphate isomerase/epimerase family protein [Bacteroidales bacterium]HQG37341.1 sugar phosphate isomerase/epimerase family protein [Bacteroidales bacterium]HQG52127.1 sugar phosphate isomerase/epimerase family protein [Bacteroidales bacterium]HQJ19830.1 sugar phosphate isomerase/epimerase family protein [Bacteroidales bacterium]
MKNKNQINRRQFVATSIAATAGLMAGANALSCSTPRKSDIKVGLYSITFLGVWYRGEAMPLEEMVKKAREFGYTGIEIDGKRPHGNPLDWPTKKCKDFRTYADGEGIEIYGVAANNDFSSPIPEHRECQIAYVKELIRMTSDFGAKTLRLFLAWPGITKHPQIAQYDIARDIWNYTHAKFSEEETWAWCREGMAECAKYAQDAGVVLALQNHKPVIRDYPEVLKMVKEVNSPNLKVSLDAPIMEDKSAEGIQKAARAVGDLQVLSHFGGEYERGSDGKVIGEDFYRYFIKAMNDIGYQGYMSYELCHPLPVVDGQTVGIEFAEKNARLAAEFMNELIKELAS